MNTIKQYIKLPSKTRDQSALATNDKNILALQSNLNEIKHGLDQLIADFNKTTDYLNNNISLPQIEKHLNDITTQTNTLISDYNSHFVSPSIIGNFVNFSDSTGSQSDSGWSYLDFALFDHKHTSLVKPQTDTEILYINTFGTTKILSGLSVSGGQTLSGALTVSGNVVSTTLVSGASGQFGWLSGVSGYYNYISGTSGFFNNLSGISGYIGHVSAGSGQFGSGANYSKFEADGTLVFSGDATVWDDLRVSPGSFDRPGVSDPTITSIQPDGSGVTTYLYQFDKNQLGSFTIQLPHGYKTGSDIYCHIHWTPGGRGVAESGNAVGWKVDYSWANIGSGFSVMSTLDLSGICSGTNYLHQITTDAVISGTNKNISSMLICNIKRTDTGTDDTWATNTSGNLPMLLEIDFHYEINTVGSRQISTK